MIFVGSKVFTHARYWQIKKFVCIIFCGGGGGARAPQAPRSYAPVEVQHFQVFHFISQTLIELCRAMQGSGNLLNNATN